MPRTPQNPPDDSASTSTPNDGDETAAAPTRSRATTRRAAATDTASIGSVDGEIRSAQDGVGIDPAPEQTIVGPRYAAGDDQPAAETAGIYDDGTGSRRKVAKGDPVPAGWTRVGDVDYAARAEGTETVEDRERAARDAR